MIIHQCVQGSKEWLKLRMGRPTSSNFDRIVTPTGKISVAGRQSYLRELAAELATGKPGESPTTPMMRAGTFYETAARDRYSMLRSVDIQQVGFVTNDAGTYGASTDGLIGTDGVLEVKCPNAVRHLEYCLFEKHVEKYRPQCQGELLVSGREWLDICSYNPDFVPEWKLALVRVERDKEFLKLLEEQLDLFVNDLNLLKLMMNERGMLHPEALPPKEFLAEADIDLIVAAKHARGEFSDAQQS